MSWKSIIMILAIPALWIVGYGLMWGVSYLFPFSEHSLWSQGLYMGVIVAIGLSVPYWMLKIGLLDARHDDASERDLTLRNIPKDREQLLRKPEDSWT